MKIYNDEIWGYFLVIFGLFLIFMSPDNIFVLKITSIVLIIMNIFMIIKVKSNNSLLLLFSLIGFINISIGITDGLNEGVGVSLWQSLGLRQYSINTVIMKSLFLNLIILNLFLPNNKVRASNSDINLSRRTSLIISSVGCIILFSILIYALFSINSTVGIYQSVSNPLYEYSILIVGFVWFYSKGFKIIDYFIGIYSIIFFIFFNSIGDRSSVFMLLTLLFLIYGFKYIKIRILTFMMVIGIPFVNFIGIFRTQGLSIFDNIATIILERGFYVDTISWAYYTSLTIGELHNRLSEPFQIAFGFLKGILGFDSPYYNLPVFARDNFLDLYNAGGGLYPSYFYAFGGYIGVIFGGLILGIIIKQLFLNNSNKNSLFRIILISLAFRWYLYSPSTLFRGLLIYTTILWLITDWFYKITNRRE
ncbi:oligosaccharide repeat unit polymerase [Streptococcus suis]|uniref:Oligosaccharide repeat unit polymerase n=1 Tax=Streptococcus suis TaxID=1307 RepID=A0A3R8TAP9_STRSU|nr:oligosaccharide repeat unit polymerase [Streptococcus suis]